MAQAFQPQRRPRVGTRRHHLHRRDLQDLREAHLHVRRSLDDPSGLFNAGFGGGTRRAIDVQEGDKLNEKALKALVKAAVALNVAKAK